MEILALFGNRLVPRVNQPVGNLSYANRRRVEIARALASGPRLLMLDEPTAGMNPAETMELAEQLKQLHTLGLTILVIEHKLDVVTRLADHGGGAGSRREAEPRGCPTRFAGTRPCSMPIWAGRMRP